MVSLLCSSSLLPSPTLLYVWLQSLPSVSISYPSVSVGRFQRRDGRMEGYCCKCNFISSFFSTALMMVITGSCPAAVLLLPSPFKEAITHVQLSVSSMVADKNTAQTLTKKGVKPFPSNLLSRLCSCITVFYRMHSILMPVIENQGILQSDDFLQSPVPYWHYGFTTSKTGTYHLHWERQENTFSASWIFHWALCHLSMSLWCADTSVWNVLDLKQW